MKKLISATLSVLMLFGGTSAIFAEPSPNQEAPSSLTLTESSHLVLDTEKGYVDMIDGTKTVGELKSEFASEITVIGSDDEPKEDSDLVATDDTVAAAEDCLKALIYGDADRNGKINLADVSKILKYIADWDSDINTDAANVDGNKKVNIADVSKLLKYIADWDDISLGCVRMVFENTKLTAENEMEGIDLYFESPLIKIGRSNTENTGRNSYKIKLARNEYESCQFFLTSAASIEGLTLELTPLTHEYEDYTLDSEVFIHYYYRTDVYKNVLVESGETIEESDYFPEPLLPLSDSFELREGRSQGFNINVFADKDAPAGMYKATLNIKDADGNVIKCANVYSYVWDFTLPDAPYSKSSFGLSSYALYSTLELYEGDDFQTLAKYYDYLLDNNLSSYQLPYPILDERADAYMSDPRVTSFKICIGENLSSPAQDDPAKLIAAFEKVNSNETWAEKGHFYYVDEPYGEGGARAIKEQHEYLENLLGTGDFDVLVPHGNSMADELNRIDMVAFLQDYVDIFVPTIHGFQPNIEGEHYHEGLWTPRKAFLKYGESLPRLQAIKNDPEKELWWYTCVSPQFPYPNLFVNHQGVMNRVLWWQQFMYDVDGYLYWATQAGWEDITKYTSYFPGNGDGLLMYYGELYGHTGPLSSWRLVQVRDGYDDFDYLRMAEQIVGTEEVVEIVNTLTTGITLIKEDPALIEAARDAVAEIIVNGN